MAWDKNRVKTGPVILRGESGNLIAPDKLAGEIKNMNMTTAGSLRSVHGPVEYVPSRKVGGQGSKVYGAPLLGIFHCTVEGGSRDILLAHFTDSSNQSHILEYEGWSGSWSRVIGPGVFFGTDTKYATLLPQIDERPRYLTQFESTPNGVVIVPQGGRAFFYDGYAVAPLGYSDWPSPPGALGPKDDVGEYTDSDPGKEINDSVNTSGYAHTGQNMNMVFGCNRLGSISPQGVGWMDPGPSAPKKRNSLGGVMAESEWRAAVQWVDRWGNVSAISGRSDPVTVSKEDNFFRDRAQWASSGKADEKADRMKVQCAWHDIAPGPDGTVGRILCRTRDLKNSGESGLFEVPNYASTGILNFCSIPDNAATFFPDNVPDSWLLKVPLDPVPVPLFKLCRMAFGRLWIANWPGSEGVLRPSEPLFWGTFPKDMEIIPDPTGNDITGMWNTQFGLLVFTQSSTYLITPNDTGEGFKSATINRTIGCVSPNSIGTLPGGVAIWLGHGGFYSYDGQSVKLVSSDITDNIIRRINIGYQLKASAAVDITMGEYRCSIPVDGSKKNNLIMVYDGVGWRERTDVKAQALCTTRDHRSYMLALGYADCIDTATSTPVTDKASVWVLDHDGRGSFETTQNEGVVETHWLKPSSSFRRSTPLRVKIWLRETIKGNLTVEVYRDWRDNPAVETAVSPQLYPTDDAPPFWGDAILGGTHVDELRPNSEGSAIDNAWTKRRPHWVVADVMVPAAEVYKFRLKYTGDWDFIGMVFEDLDSDGGGAKIPRGGSNGY